MRIYNYLHQFQNLNTHKTGSKVAPHKPILLLSVIDLIESGVIDSAFIPISEDLERRFKMNWKRYVPRTSTFKCGMQYPFYHLSSSSFWHLRQTATGDGKAPSSMTALKRNFVGAAIDEELFKVLQDETCRKELRNTLISTYLSDANHVVGTTLLTAFAMVRLLGCLMANG